MSASATQVTVYEVLQPVFSDRGLVATGFSYARFDDTLNEPTLLVCLTAAESRLGGPDGFANWNEANLAGVHIYAAEHTPGPGRLYPGLSGDTLKVILDLSGLSHEDPVSKAEVLDLTVHCMRENASRDRRHKVHFLSIAVSGDSTYSKYAAVYELQE